MKIATAKDMRQIDKKSMEVYGVPELVLMENAGVQVAREMENLLGEVAQKRICICCGQGNNGGDGMVAARHLANGGARVKVFFLGDTEKWGTAAKSNFAMIQNMQIDFLEITNDRDWDKVQVALAFSDGIIDGLLGTGFYGDLRPSMEKMIALINEAQKLVVAIDVPSGVNADSGQVQTNAVKASSTISFGLPKVGLFFCPGAFYVGKLLVDGIGIPHFLLESDVLRQQLIDVHVVQDILQPRKVDVHKNSCGRVLVIAGSKGMSGAAALAAEAVLRSGAGVATLAVPESLQPVMAMKLTEVMTAGMPEAAPGVLGEAGLEDLLELAEKHDVVLIGPGLGRHEETIRLVQKFLAACKKQVIVDADALYACTDAADCLLEMEKIPVLTPHLGEMARFLGISVGELKENLLEISREAAEKYRCIFVVKSEKTIIVTPEGMVSLSSNGNPGMATAGSGDVLAGVIASFAAQGLTEEKAAITGVFLHGFAGDLAAEHGMSGLIAGDLVRALPAARCGLGNE